MPNNEVQQNEEEKKGLPENMESGSSETYNQKTLEDAVKYAYEHMDARKNELEKNFETLESRMRANMGMQGESGIVSDFLKQNQEIRKNLATYVEQMKNYCKEQGE